MMRGSAAPSMSVRLCQCGLLEEGGVNVEGNR